MPVPIGAAQLAAVWAAIALGALVQGVVGFGMALVAAPILFMIDPILVPGPLLCCGLVLTAMIAIRERHSSGVHGLGVAVVGLCSGATLGAGALTIASQERLAFLLGCLVLFAVLLSAAGLHMATTRSSVFVASTMAGFMGTTASIPGPPLALVHQREGGARLRGTLSPMLFVSGLISITALTAVGRFGSREVVLALALSPSVFLGFAASRFVARLFSPETLRVAVLILSGLSAGAVILRSVM